MAVATQLLETGVLMEQGALHAIRLKKRYEGDQTAEVEERPNDNLDWLERISDPAECQETQ